MAKISVPFPLSLGCLFLCGTLGLLYGCGDDGDGGTLVTVPGTPPPSTPTPLPPPTPGPDPNPPGGDAPVDIDITSPTLVFVPFVVVVGNELSITTEITTPAGLADTILVEVNGPSSFFFVLAPEDIGCQSGNTTVCNSTRVAVLPDNSPPGDYTVDVTVFDVLGQQANTDFVVEVVNSGEVPPLVEITDPPEPITIPALSPLTFSGSILPPDRLSSPISIFLIGNATTGEFISLEASIPVEDVNCQVGSVELCNAIFTDLFPSQIPAGEYTLTLQAVDQLNNTGSDQVLLIAQ